jgi:hypothetical protein
MAAIEKFAKHPESGRTSFLLEIDSLDDWPEDLVLPKSKHFVLFLAADASDLSVEDLAAFTTKTLDQGMVYLSTWGKDAERVHDTFEEAAAEWDPDSDADSALLSEWHEDEPLSEALRFSVAHALPAHDFEKGCKATLVAIVGNPDAAELVRDWLGDPEKLEKAADDDEKVPGAEDEEEEKADDEDADLDDDDDDEEPADDDDDDDDDDGGDDESDDD